MTTTSRHPATALVVRALSVLSLSALVAAFAVGASGGFSLLERGVRVSVRSPRPLVAIGLVAALAAAALGCRRVAQWRDSWNDLAAVPAAFWAAGIAAVTFAVGLLWGTAVAGGADSAGYVAQSALWLDGSLVGEPELGPKLRWAVNHSGFAPLGFSAAATPGAIVPTYPPGLPLTMAFARICGGPAAVWVVVPALGAIAVWTLFAVVRRPQGDTAALVASLLFASNGTFLYQLVQPMSDVPATAWWLLAALGAATATPPGALGGGLAAAMAIATRPNLAPLAAVIAPFAGALRNVPWSLRNRWRLVAVFCLGAAPGALLVAVVNDRLYGSPLMSGYGPADYLYSWSNFRPNLERYTSWLRETHPLLLLLPPLALMPWLWPATREGRRFVALAFALMGAVGLSYATYFPFGDPSYLRFLLPAFPFAVALAALVLVRLTAQLPRPLASVALCLVAIGIAGSQVRVAKHLGTFLLRSQEQRYEQAAGYVAERGADRTLVLAAQHSGSVHYYSGAPVLRFDLLDATGLEAAVDLAVKERRAPLLVMDRAEEPAFRKRFAGQTRFADLDWPPRARTLPDGSTVVYDLLDRDRYLRGDGYRTSWIGQRP